MYERIVKFKIGSETVTVNVPCTPRESEDKIIARARLMVEKAINATAIVI